MQLSNALIYGDRLRCGSTDVANAKLNFAKENLYSSWLKVVTSVYYNLSWFCST